MRCALHDLYWVAPPWMGLCGRIGGWGFKWVRRWLGPFALGWLAWAYGIRWWKCLAYSLSTTLAFSLGYSPEQYGLWGVAGCGALYGATPWCLGFRRAWWWWPLATSAAFAVLTAFSLYQALPWGLVEVAIFSLHGFWVSWVLHRVP